MRIGGSLDRNFTRPVILGLLVPAFFCGSIGALAADLPAESAPGGIEALDPAPEASAGASEDSEFEGRFDSVEEMVVQGQATAMGTQEATSSVTSFGSIEIEQQNFSDLRDISAFTPNLEIKSSFGASNPTLFIRGVGLNDFNANSASAVAIYNDDIYMNSPAGQLGQIFDLEAIDVLRGPQGALYGYNASAGAIRVVSRKPVGEYSARGIMTYGKYNTLEFQGALEMPIIDDQLSWRGSFRYNERDGITRNGCGGLPEGSTTGDCYDSSRTINNRRPIPANLDVLVNNKKNWAARSILRWQPAEMDWLLNVHGGQNLGGAMQFQGVGTRTTYGGTGPQGYPYDYGDAYAGQYNKNGQELLDLFGVSLTGLIPLGDNYTLRTVTGYEENSRSVDEDSDAGPYRVIEVTWTNRAYQVTQDLNLSSNFGGEFEWEGGLFILTEELHVNNKYEVWLPIYYRQIFDQSSQSVSPYINGNWEFLENLKLEAGLRYTWQQKNFALDSRKKISISPAEQVLIETSELARWSGLSGNFSVNWYAADDVTVYGKYSRGWKGGHFNGGAITESQSDITPVDPETVDAFEVGLKSFLYDRRVSLNAAVFYYDYSDLQVFTLANSDQGLPIQKLINANDARVLGTELELVVTPIDDLRLVANFGWVNARYLDFQDTLFIARPGSRPKEYEEVVQNYSGNPLVSAPNFSLSGTAEYTYPLGGDGSGGTLSLRWDFAFKDDVYFDPTKGVGVDPDLEYPAFALGQPAFWTHDFRFAWRSPDERYEIALWVQNAFDEVYLNDAFDLSQGFDLILEVVGDPRTVGATVSVAF